MRKLLLASALTFMSTPALGQAIDVAEVTARLDKARLEVNTAENAAARAQTACANGTQPKCNDEVRTTKNALSRALYAIDKALEAVKPAVPTPTPTPAPTPTPTPAPTGEIDPTPGVGMKAIASNVALTFSPRSAVPQLTAYPPYDREGAFRFICGAGQLSYDDPIVYPGELGKSHLHQFYGNTGANAESTFVTLRTSGLSTCNYGSGPANRSAYWTVAMLDGKGQVVLPEWFQVYYKGPPKRWDDAKRGSINLASYPDCDYLATKGTICKPIPNGIRFISGFDMASGTNKPGQQVAKFKCISINGSTPLTSDQNSLVGLKPKCVVGGYLEMSIQSLKCWNGQLDSADHRSHLAPTLTNQPNHCPSSHPYLIPQFTQSAFYLLKTGDDLDLFSVSSDAMYPNLPKGSTAHFDYFEGWDVSVKVEWTDNCIRLYRNASGGDLCDKRALSGAESGTVRIEAAKFPHRVLVPVNPHAGH